MTQPRILDDEWEPPPRPNRRPALVAVSLLVSACIAFATVRAGVWTRAESEALPFPLSRSRSLWYPQDSFEARNPDQSDPAPPLAPPPPPPSRPPSPRHSTPKRAVPSLPGYLSINSTPWAELAVDGIVVGNTPKLGIRVTPGQHELLFVRDGFEVRRMRVTVAPGATLRITDVELTRIAP